MRVLIVKLSSLGDVIHAMPVVQDIRRAHPGAVVDWVVEPGFAPLVRRLDGIGEVIECPLRRWRKGWWTAGVRREFGAFKARLQHDRYDAVLDLQGLTKSAFVARLARGTRYALANRTEGSSWEPATAWVADHAIRVEPHIHAMDRSRLLAAMALSYTPDPVPHHGLRARPLAARGASRPTIAFVHGSSRDDKLWPTSSWIQLGKRLLGDGFRLALPQAGEAEQTRAELIAAALQFERDLQVEVWPSLALDAVLDRLAATQGAIGVDSGLSHLAVALGLPHVQLYNFPTAWRTGPQPAHGHHHQVSIEGRPTPTLEAVWAAWNAVRVADTA